MDTIDNINNINNNNVYIIDDVNIQDNSISTDTQKQQMRLKLIRFMWMAWKCITILLIKIIKLLIKQMKQYLICLLHIAEIGYNSMLVFTATTNTRAKRKKVYAKKLLCHFIDTMEDKQRKKIAEEKKTKKRLKSLKFKKSKKKKIK